MATRPSTTPTWATDTNFPAGGDAWSATPTRVAPSAGEQGTGLVPATRPPAQFLNWILGFLADWIAYVAAIIDADEEHTYQTPKTRTRVWAPSFGGGIAARVGGTDQWFWQNFSTGMTEGYRLRATAAGNLILLPVSSIVPPGATVTRYEALVGQGGSSDMSMWRQIRALDFATPAAPTFTKSSVVTTGLGTSGVAVLDSGAVSLSVADKTGDTLEILIAAANANDYVDAVRITYEDPGPRSA